MEPTNLDFEKADFGTASAGAKCASCSKDLRITYYEANGLTVCTACRQQLAAAESSEGGIGRFLRASIYGAAGGMIGAVIWYAIGKLFNLELGIIAIAVGWLVGTGVQRGSQGRGGLKYQVLAVLIAYVSIVSTYIPYIVEAAREPAGGSASQNNSSASVSASDPAPAPELADSSAPIGNRTPDTNVAVTPTASAAAESTEKPTFGQFLVALISLAGLVLAVPFLQGFSNIIGILIIFFALQQAWALNKRRVIEIKGPFRVAAASSAPAVAAAPAVAPTDPSHGE